MSDMNEREAAQRLMRARARLLPDPEKKLSPEEFFEAAEELAAAEAALPKRHKPDLVLSALESTVEELDRLLEGDEVFPEVLRPTVFPAGIRDKVAAARRLLNDARTAIVEQRSRAEPRG